MCNIWIPKIKNKDHGCIIIIMCNELGNTSWNPTDYYMVKVKSR